MRTTWTIAPAVCLLILGVAACHVAEPACGPGQDDPRCLTVIVDPPPALDEGEAQARLADIHAEYEIASADGLEADECREFSERYQALYERDNTITTARFNVAVIHEDCGQLDLAEQIYVELSDRGHPQALNNLGVLAWSSGDRSGSRCRSAR